MDPKTQQSESEPQSQEPHDAPGGNTPSQTQSQQPNADPAPDPAKPSKPDDLDDDLWDADKGELKVDDLLSRFKELKTFKTEADAAKAGIPEKPDGYEVGLPEDFELPEGATWDPYPADHPVVKMAQEAAHKMGLGQDGFKQLVALKAQSDIAEDREFAARAAEERKALGDRGPARIDAVQNWLKGQLGDDGAEALFPMLLTANQIGAFEKLQTQFRTGGAPSPSPRGNEAGAEEEDLSQLTGAERIAAARRRQANR